VIICRVVPKCRNPHRGSTRTAKAVPDKDVKTRFSRASSSLDPHARTEVL
jgi:hypothetical protein